MNNNRPHTSTIIVGRRFTGKSTYLATEIIPIYLKQKKRIIIITATDPTAYEKIPRIYTFDNLRTWLIDDKQTPAVKFYSSDDPFKMIKELNSFAQNEKIINNMLLIFEDATNYIDANPDRAVKNFLVNHRMYNCDLIFTLHAIEFIPPFFSKMSNYLTIFKTNDALTLQYLKTRRITKYIELFNAWLHVMKQASQNYKTTISLE
jgi:hypothetical protein